MLSIKYLPLVEHPVFRAFALFMGLISTVPLLFTVNHTPNYSGMLPLEFMLIPIALLVSAAIWCDLTITSKVEITLTWRFAGLAIKSVKANSFALVREQKYLRLVLNDKISTSILLSEQSDTAIILSQIK